MALNFPSPATEGQTYTAEGATYIYKNGRWVVLSSAQDMSAYVAKAGDTMTGMLAANAGVTIVNDQPQLRMQETDATDPKGRWYLQASSSGGSFGVYNAGAIDWTGGGSFWRCLSSGTSGVNYDRFLVDVPLANGITLKGSTVDFRFDESDTVAPAGQYRHYVNADVYYFQRALTADHVTNTIIWSYDGAAVGLFTVPGIAQIGTVNINRAANGSSTSHRISSGGSTAIQSFDSSTFVTMYNGAGTLNGRFDNAGAAAPAQTYSVVTREKGDARYTAISSRRYKRNIAKQPLDALTHVFDHLVPHRWTWGGEVPRGDERLGRKGIGFVAEEVHELLPAASIMRRVPIDIPLDENDEQDANAPSYSEDMRVDGIDHGALIAVLFAKIKQLEERLEAVEATG